MIDTPILALPNFGHLFVVQIDVCGIREGAVLSQQGHPIASFSKQIDEWLICILSILYL